VMKPKPFWSLNHFTRPLVRMPVPSSLLVPAAGGVPTEPAADFAAPHPRAGCRVATGER
jgi:hypothetical protein